MEISFVRSSFLNQWEYCQQSAYITYCLGHTQETNQKTEQGTIVHKVLEILANMKKNYQDTGRYFTIDESLGEITCSEESFLEPRQLTEEEIIQINKERKNKNVFMDQKIVNFGLIRYGEEFIKHLTKLVYNYYVEKSKHEWQPIHYKQCENYVWIELDWSNGNFDPRKRQIYFAEYPFEFEIKEDWAKINEDQYLKIKGTIDLTTVVGNSLEIIDYKTGQRLNWATGKKKEYEDLMKDKQLMLYYYAARKVFPKFDNIALTIFFVRDGGPFTLAFDDSVIQEVENNLKNFLNNVKNTKVPKLLDKKHKDFRCARLCTFYKNKVNESCFCDYIHNEVKLYGIDLATLKNRAEGFKIDNYQQPGE